MSLRKRGVEVERDEVLASETSAPRRVPVGLCSAKRDTDWTAKVWEVASAEQVAAWQKEERAAAQR